MTLFLIRLGLILRLIDPEKKYVCNRPILLFDSVKDVLELL